MPTVASRPFEEQHAFNRQVWEHLVNDPAFAETIEKVETDRDGNLIMSPPPKRPRSRRANRIAKLLDRLLPAGFWQVDDTVSTPEGVKVPDVSWYGQQRAAASDADQDEILSTVAPDVCVEVVSPSNSARELRKKMKPYFAAGVREVWVCDRHGKMSFYGPRGVLTRSAICPDFPDQVPVKFLE
ncbi:MAG: Uma2 family endonuclease [Verrucomicrobia bacterium]|nr:Uma2 family endonuclease [Verrucomicrobiota bacterium]